MNWNCLFCYISNFQRIWFEKPEDRFQLNNCHHPRNYMGDRQDQNLRHDRQKSESHAIPHSI